MTHPATSSRSGLRMTPVIGALLTVLTATGGALVHQVALGYPTLDHTSLAANSTGRWLLYLAGNDLYVSENGARPSKLATGLIAATWL